MSPLLSSLLAISATISTAYSLPSGWTSNNEKRGTPTLPLSDVSNTGASPLPTPSTNPKYITLGLGFQNYTCSASGTYVQTVPSTGAVADLYDITTFLTPYTHDTITKTTLQAFEVCLSATHCTPSPQNSYCGACHTMAAAPYRLGQKGVHYFDQLNGAQTPNFDLYAGGDFLSAKKAGDVKAPVGAYDGENGLGAIDWLYLVDNGSGRSHGLKSVYRVETAGGVAPKTCTPGAQLQVPYAAEYWFY
ncbi:hypothetical protein PRZ48_005091 [Zasmidium cellare]|uniref:Malate dehydrogenase n=1 Tax=Zasmidium cellare TaxID=395010 RepID=A0ABR0ESE1_ZASCE|nr:hypothetical protein PRZ48_005091 [Zasmidium cellare]